MESSPTGTGRNPALRLDRPMVGRHTRTGSRTDPDLDRRPDPRPCRRDRVAGEYETTAKTARASGSTPASAGSPTWRPPGRHPGLAHDITERKRWRNRCGGKPPQGRVPRAAGPRAAEPAGAAAQRPAGHAACVRRPSAVAQAGDDGAAARPHGPADRRPARRLAHQPQQDGAAPRAGAAGGRAQQRRRDRPPADRRRGAHAHRLAADASRCLSTPT